ncbi:UNVERIFIED_CONTAM: hypothetical protein Sradi_2032000 [Sesamum radiatum]|uniref:DUF4283 domain-containing protein n=1 Tax=Sesamum radiatum TaxID=300843 RepID=A0AAW2THZ8_SESRA
MEKELGKLGSVLKLSTEEEESFIIPDGLWQAESDGNQLCLVGRLLSNRSYNFDRLSTSIKNMLQLVKGVEIKGLPEGRLLLCFNHVIDRNRAFEGCPWSFEHNILILNGLTELDNPMTVDRN